MSYVKTTWSDDLTELNAENMNHIESGIKDNEDALIVLDNKVDTNDSTIIQIIGTNTNTWNSSASYSIDDVVVYNKKLYKNLTGNNATNPSDDTTNWQEISIILNNKLNSLLDDISFIKNVQTSSSSDVYSCTYINNLISSLPTSDIEESGTNYIRLSDGTQICFDSKSISTQTEITFPKAFKTGTTPMVVVQKNDATTYPYIPQVYSRSATSFKASLYYLYTQNYTISGGSYSVAKYTTSSGYISYIAIGKWK